MLPPDTPFAPWVLCDLGKVIVGFEHGKVARRLLDWMSTQSACEVPSLEALHAFFFDGSPNRNKLMDTGVRDLAWIGSELAATFGVAPPPALLAAFWTEIFTTTNADVLRYLRAARAAGSRVGICSNTNAPHWEYVRRTYPEIEGTWDTLFLSYELGESKPAPAYYEAVLSRTGAPPADHLFIDDLAANVDAARTAGMRGIVYAPA